MYFRDALLLEEKRLDPQFQIPCFYVFVSCVSSRDQSEPAQLLTGSDSVAHRPDREANSKPVKRSSQRLILDLSFLDSTNVPSLLLYKYNQNGTVLNPGAICETVQSHVFSGG